MLKVTICTKQNYWSIIALKVKKIRLP